ncbi:hypothetical protein FH608_002220 [Nonomuraea phyllanthi]|uniref:Uncharacterized protein n=1 Tax=Nonomuraea phyllanthi TaxID=2219224 RepID=A0A5C4WVA9_9ACTN|nr:hypothetical protein [Nonomuraea phyllanthi]KAB8197397.1 hypothetical protein FH608_002220 [Nonomuraea phyllanthi]
MTTHTMTRAALAATLAGGLALAGFAPAAHAAQTRDAAAAQAAPARHGSTAARAAFGPYGYGGVKLGMSAKTAKATGKVVHKRGLDSVTCSGWDLKAHRNDRNSVGLYISKKRGVAVMFAPKHVRTPQGIGLGSTHKQIKKAYPKVKTAASGFPYVKAPGNPKAYYSFLLDDKGRVYEMALGLLSQDCVN